MNNNYEYSGKLEQYQLEGSKYKGKRYASYEIDTLNQYQNFLYKRAMYGLKMYTDKEIATMGAKNKQRIISIQQKTQRILNLYKQEVVNKLSNNIFTRLFPNSPITNALVGELTFTDSGYINTIDFKSLGITKELIINKLIKENILPSNFYELKNIKVNG
jgi:hypothetical protein